MNDYPNPDDEIASPGGGGGELGDPLLRGLAGAGVGALIGTAIFWALLQIGLYGAGVPGAALGIGFGTRSGRESTGFGVLCGVLGLILGLVLEWIFRPFLADPSFTYFVTHLGELTARTWLLVVLGAVFAFWFGRGRG